MAEAAVEWIGAQLLNAGLEELGAALIFESSAIVTAAQFVTVAAAWYTLPELARAHGQTLEGDAA